MGVWREAGGGQGREEQQRGISVRWGLVGDADRVSELLELNGMARTLAFEERFVVAEEKGRLLAALQYRMDSKRLSLGFLVVDPWLPEHPLVVALYTEAGELARDAGVVEVLARPVPHTKYLYEAGFRRSLAGWRLDITQPPGLYRELPSNGWRRIAALLGALPVPFHHAFRDRDLTKPGP